MKNWYTFYRNFTIFKKKSGTLYSGISGTLCFGIVVHYGLEYSTNKEPSTLSTEDVYNTEGEAGDTTIDESDTIDALVDENERVDTTINDEIAKDDTSFECDNKIMVWYGAFQYLLKGQKKEMLHFGRCLSGENSFDIVWYANSEIDDVDEVRKLFKDEYEESIEVGGFTTYLFKLPLDEIEDEVLDSPYIFPCKVFCYKLTDDNKPEMMGEYSIDDWESYVQLQYKTIYGGGEID